MKLFMVIILAAGFLSTALAEVRRVEGSFNDPRACGYWINYLNDLSPEISVSSSCNDKPAWAELSGVDDRTLENLTGKREVLQNIAFNCKHRQSTIKDNSPAIESKNIEAVR